jgi:hypothetical protein
MPVRQILQREKTVNSCDSIYLLIRRKQNSLTAYLTIRNYSGNKNRFPEEASAFEIRINGIQGQIALLYPVNSSIRIFFVWEVIL